MINNDKSIEQNTSDHDSQKKTDDLNEALRLLETEYLRINETVRQRGNKWVLLSSAGKVLGTHDTKQEAKAQETAIQISKHS